MEYKANLFDYLKWRGDISFKGSPFNKIDGMILSRFSYAPFELVFKNGENGFQRLSDVTEKMLARNDIENIVLDPEDVELFRLLGESGRFRDLMVGNFADRYDREDEVQFSAITIRFSEDTYGIAYRGTDNTLIGWKEDLNMGFILPVASQLYAKEYLEDIAKRTGASIVLMGHSKGGNLAVYAAAFCQEEVQGRIADVYNYDGPGFEESVLETEGYGRICERIHTFVPQSSVVGMLLGHKEEHQVVHSQEFRGLSQHNVYSWEVQGKEFLYEEDVTKKSRYLDNTMKNWIAGMDKEKREMFVEALYSLVSDTRAKTLKEMKNDWVENSQLIIKSMKNMDEGTKQYIKDGIALFIKCAWNNR